MKFKKVLIGTICAVLLTSTCITASAVEKISTRDFYMNGYKINASITLYSNYAQGYTYCADATAKKSALTCYKFKGTDRVEHVYITHKKQSNEYGISETTEPAKNIDYYLGAMTEGVVQMKQSYYKWESEGTDCELRMGIYKR